MPTDPAPRALHVEAAEPAFGDAGRRHAILVGRGGDGVDVVHVWTSDPALAALLVPGRTLVLSLAP